MILVPAEEQFREEDGLRVAAIQVQGEGLSSTQTLEAASRLVKSASRQGAQLILCPELMASAYTLGPSLWESAETRGGPTESWLQSMSQELGIHIGAGFLEAEGDDLFNTFTLAVPGGRVAGRVRKHTHGFLEASLFKTSSEPRIIDTDLGRIGVGICFDNYRADFLMEMHDSRADIILMPHCWPTQTKPNRFTQVMDSVFAQIAAEYARLLEVPVVLSNKAGISEFRSPIPGIPKVRATLRFIGGSTICDSNGNTLTRLDSGEGLAIADIPTARAMKKDCGLQTNRFWAIEPRRFSRWLALSHRLITFTHRAGYRYSRRRRCAAQLASADPGSHRSACSQ